MDALPFQAQMGWGSILINKHFTCYVLEQCIVSLEVRSQIIKLLELDTWGRLGRVFQTNYKGRTIQFSLLHRGVSTLGTYELQIDGVTHCTCHVKL